MPVYSTGGAVFICSDLGSCSITNLGTKDHHLLDGLADDDHTQYYNAARHTKAVHDSLGLDHGSLSGKGDDDHTQYLLINGTRAMTGDLDLNSNAIRNALEVEFSADLAFTPLSATILELVNKANTAYNSLGLAYLLVHGGIDMNQHSLIDLPTPTSDYHAATKKYVDDNVSAFSCSDLNACSIANLGTKDHHLLTGLGDDDHTQYYNAARHTKAVHDSLGLDHGSLSGKGDYDHDQYLRKNGTQAMTGDLDLNAHALRNASEVEFSVDLAFTPLSADILELVNKANTVFKSLRLAYLDTYSGINVHNHKIINVLTPTANYDAATKKYVDDHAGATDHGALTGLADYDHDQYLRKNGTQAMTGDLNLNSNDIDNVGDLYMVGNATIQPSGNLYLNSGGTVLLQTDLLPNGDNMYTLGYANPRWSDLYAVVVHEGDVAFAEKECIKCNKKFKVGDNIVYKVIRIDEETGEPMAIPIHLECANTPPQKVKKRYAVEEDYYIWDEEKGEAVKRKRKKSITKRVKKRKIKEDFEIDDKTGKFWKHEKREEAAMMVRAQQVSVNEATEEIEEEVTEVIYKEEEFTI